MTSPSSAEWRRAAAITGGAFGLLIVISAAQLYALRRASNESSSLPVALAFGAATWVVWVAAAPLILALGRRFDFRRGRRLLSVGVHVAMMLAVHIPATLLLIRSGLMLFAPDEPFPWADLPRQLYGSRLQLAMLIYGSIVGVGRGVTAWRSLREQDRRAARLEAQATQARLEALALRLQPHFLFNALHAAGALIDEDPGRARAMIVELGDLLRRLLADPDVVEVPLGDEISLLNHYLAIERIRFADRLTVTVDVPTALHQVPVPRLLLQPLVENALRHGLARRAAGGTVRITGVRDGDQVRLSVWNEGTLDGEEREGNGLAMTRQRLATRYGDRAALELRSDVDGGIEAVVRIPERG